MAMSIDVSKSYKPGKDFVKDDKESLVDLNLTENTELWLLNLPLSKVSLFLLYAYDLFLFYLFVLN
jgi:hypothetical protein